MLFNHSRAFTQREFYAPRPCRAARSPRSCSAPRAAAAWTTTCCPTSAGPTPRRGCRTTDIDRWTVNVGARMDYNSPVSEDENRLNYIFDPSIVNPASSGIDQTRFPGYQVRGGLTFVGVDGNPDKPWKSDNNNFQVRVGTAFQLNERTVLRGGYGDDLNPTGQGHIQGFSVQSTLVASLDGGRTPTYALSNRYPTGSPSRRAAPAGRSRSSAAASPTPIRTSRCRRWTTSPSACSASCPGDDTRRQLRRQPEQRHRGELRRLQRAVGSIPGAVRRHAGREPQPLRPAGHQPVLQRRRFRGHDAVYESDPFPVRARPAVPRVQWLQHRYNDQLLQHEPAEPRQDAIRLLQFVANKRLARGVTINAGYTWVPRWTEVGASTTTGIGNAYVDEVSLLENDGPYFSHREHRIPASGVWQLPWCTRADAASRATCSAAGQSRRRSSTNPDSPGTCLVTSTWRGVDPTTSRSPGTRTVSSSMAWSRASASATRRRADTI